MQELIAQIKLILEKKGEKQEKRELKDIYSFTHRTDRIINSG